MGSCLNSPRLTSQTHPILGPIQVVNLLNRSLIKFVDFSVSETKLKQWQNTIKLTQQKNPELLSIIFLPIISQTTFTCSLNTVKEFYFQNYRRNLMMQKRDRDLKGIGYSQQRIRQIGQVLFELIKQNPEIDEEVNLENILLNDDGKIKIALKKYLPLLQNIQFKRVIGCQKKLRWTQETDYSTSPRLSLLTNVQFRHNNLLLNISKIILSLVSQNIRYSYQFKNVVKELRKVDKDQQVLYDYFLNRIQKNPKNYFLDMHYIQTFEQKSNDTSLFLVTQSGWTDFNSY